MKRERLSDVVGLLLASGRGTRFDQSGQRNKLLASLPDGRSVLRAAAQTLCDAVFRVIVVVRDESPALEQAIAGLPLEVIHNPRAALGMGTSIAAGVAISGDAAGWLIALGDMPFIQPGTISAVGAPLLTNSSLITAPTYLAERGHPVGFGRAHRTALTMLEGDQGARSLLRDHPVLLLPVSDSGILRDIDTPGDLET